MKHQKPAKMSTATRVMGAAARILLSPHASKGAKSVAASALTHRRPSPVKKAVANILKDKGSPNAARLIAGSARLSNTVSAGMLLVIARELRDLATLLEKEAGRLMPDLQHGSDRTHDVVPAGCLPDHALPDAPGVAPKRGSTANAKRRRARTRGA